MRAYVTLKTPDDRLHELMHGDIIGRIWSAALQLNDGRISEAHAMVSLRDGNLQLIALRGSFAINGQPASQVVLAPNLEVELARGLSVQVVEVWLPEEVMGIEGSSLMRQILPGVCSVLTEPSGVRIVSGYREEAALLLWDTGDGWMKRVPRGEASSLLPDAELGVGGLKIVRIPLHAAGAVMTRRKGELDGPVTVRLLADSAHIQQTGATALALGGKQAELLHLLYQHGKTMTWQSLAEILWPDVEDRSDLRARLDIVVSRVRRSLRAKGIRADLVRTDSRGMIELFLYPHDVMEPRIV